MKRLTGMLLAALALLHNEWRVARATLLAGIPFAGVFVALCDVAFTKDDPTFLAYTAMPAITALIVAAIAADLCSRDVDARDAAGVALLPVSPTFVFVVRLVFLGAAAVLVGCGVRALGHGWLTYYRPDATYADIYAARYLPLAWAAIAPAIACVVLASACALRGMTALLAGLGSLAAIVALARRIEPADFGVRIGTREILWIAAAVTLVAFVVAERVHALSAHRIVGAGRRLAWAGLVLAAFVAPAGVVSATVIRHSLRCAPGDGRMLEMLSLSPDERHVAIRASGDHLLYRKTWIVDVHDGSTIVLPGFAMTSTYLGVEWLSDDRVRVPFRRFDFGECTLVVRLGTFDRATGELLEEEEFDSYREYGRGFTINWGEPQVRISGMRGPGVRISGFGQSFGVRDLVIGDRAGACAVRLEGGRVGFFDFTKSAAPHAIIDDVGDARAAELLLLSGSDRLLIETKHGARVVSTRDGRELISIPHPESSRVYAAHDGSSDRFLWRFDRTGTSADRAYALIDIETGETRSVDGLMRGSSYGYVRILDDGSLLSVKSDGRLRRGAPDGTETLLPLRLK